jgi:ABC-type phosphate/phosphonate transport system permease subunit
MQSVVGYVLTAMVSFPVSFFIARSCLRGVVRILNGGMNRDVL